MRLVVVESPYAAPTVEGIARNLAYARAAMADCLRRGEYPIASHLLYTQPGILDDTIPAERTLGIEAGLAWARCGKGHAIYIDLGVTPGMEIAIERARAEGRAVEMRTLPGWDAEAKEANHARALGQSSAPLGEIGGSDTASAVAHFEGERRPTMGSTTARDSRRDGANTVDPGFAAAALSELDGCPCYACQDRPRLGMENPVVSRMIVCPTCGNKRCPHAAHHDNTCTNSNEYGQMATRRAPADTIPAPPSDSLVEALPPKAFDSQASIAFADDDEPARGDAFDVEIPNR